MRNRESGIEAISYFVAWIFWLPGRDMEFYDREVSALDSANKAFIRNGLLAGLSLVIVFPIFSLFGNSWLFQVGVVVHLVLVCLLWLASVNFLAAVFKSRLLGYGLVILPLVLILPDLILPVTYKDSLIHHLFIAKVWSQAGSPIEFDWHNWSYYPMALQSVFVFLLPLGEQLCVVYHALYLWPLAALAVVLARHLNLSERASALAGSLVLFTPVCLQLAGTAMVDLGLSYYCLLALVVALVAGIERSSLLAIGIALGVALSIKYNALIFLVALTIFLLYLWSSKQKFKALSAAVAFSLIVAGLVYSPWLLRNLEITGNPVYPLFNSVFGIVNPWERLPELGPWEQRIFLYKESLIELVLLPFRMIFFGEEGNPRRFDGVASPLIILSLIPLFMGKLSREVKGIFLLVLVDLALSLYMGPARIRYLAPIFGPLAVLSALGADRVLDKLSGRRDLIFGISIFGQACFGVYSAFNAGNYVNAKQYLQGDLARAIYLADEHPEFSLIQEVNGLVGSAGCVYALYTANAFYWYTGCVESDGYQPARRLITWLKRSDSAAELAENLRAAGFSHLFIHKRRLNRIIEANLNEEKQKMWQGFLTGYAQEEFEQRGYGLLVLKN